jgi:hypothetical protein
MTDDEREFRKVWAIIAGKIYAAHVINPDGQPYEVNIERSVDAAFAIMHKVANTKLID